jgi:hypothetical protein
LRAGVSTVAFNDLVTPALERQTLPLSVTH